MRTLICTLLLALVAPALAADALDAPSVARARGRTTITVTGRVPADGQARVARLRRLAPGALDEDRVALETPLLPGADGAFTAELVTPALLAAGRYEVEVAAAGDAARSALRAPLQVGDAAEAVAAEARLVAWYRGAYGTFRDLAAALERRGAYHLALLKRTEEDVHRRRFIKRFLEGWSASLRAARMDLATWERRLVLPAHARVGRMLLELVPLLDARAKVWERALLAPGTPVDAQSLAAIDVVVAPLCEAIADLAGDAPAGEAPRMRRAWGAGPLATPPPGDPAGVGVLEGVAWSGGHGVLADPELGYSLEVPQGAEAKAADTSPDERVVLDVPAVGGAPGFKVIVQVRDLYVPDADVAAALEVAAWEGYQSYERRESAPLEGGAGLRLVLDAEWSVDEDPDTGQRAGHGSISAVQRSLWRRLQDGAVRVVTVVVVRLPGEPWSPAMARLEASLSLLGGAR